jgi:hypothetical protein
MMKRLISLLAVAMFATVFAAGCGKLAKCSAANNQGSKTCTESAGFEPQMNCDWTAKAGAAAGSNDGDCAPKAAELAADKQTCAAVVFASGCGTAVLASASVKAEGLACKANAANNACELK